MVQFLLIGTDKYKIRHKSQNKPDYTNKQIIIVPFKIFGVSKISERLLKVSDADQTYSKTAKNIINI